MIQKRKGKKKSKTHKFISIYTQVKNNFAYKQIRDFKKSSFSIFDDVLSLEVKTLSFICQGKPFQILHIRNFKRLISFNQRCSLHIKTFG